MVTINLGTCAIQNNMVFGWSVLTEHGWMPFDQVQATADSRTCRLIGDALHNPVVPDEARIAWDMVDVPF